MLEYDLFSPGDKEFLRELSVFAYTNTGEVREQDAEALREDSL